MRKRERGGCEKGGGEANGGTGRVEQMGEKESERERERESERTHTPFCTLSGQTHPHMVGVSVLWSSNR